MTPPQRQGASRSRSGGESAQLAITQTKSAIGCTDVQRATLASLGLRRMHQTVLRPDRPEVRGMVDRVSHLVEVRREADGGPAGGRAAGDVRPTSDEPEESKS